VRVCVCGFLCTFNANIMRTTSCHIEFADKTQTRTNGRSPLPYRVGVQRG
jgi:hypothetical protein